MRCILEKSGSSRLLLLPSTKNSMICSFTFDKSKPENALFRCFRLLPLSRLI